MTDHRFQRVTLVPAPDPLDLSQRERRHGWFVYLLIAAAVIIGALAGCSPEPVAEARTYVERRIVIDCKGPCFADRPKPTRLVCAEVR